MFKELVNLGRDLDGKGLLPSVGFYTYSQPIKWVVHLWPDKVYIEAAELDKSRPYSGRTSDIQAHLLADEAGYALGVSQDKGGATDKRAANKHEAFRQLVKKFLGWQNLQDAGLFEALGWLESALDNRLVQADPRYGEMLTKDWVSFVPEGGPLVGEHLFEHPEAKTSWVAEIQERSAPGEKSSKKVVLGECSVCGSQDVALVGKIPLGVKLAGTVPLHSYNASAFPSFYSGAAPEKSAHLGLCFTCGDSAARAFNYLSNSDKHKKSLVWDKDKRDSLANQTALFWLKAEKDSKLEIGKAVFDMEDLLASVGTALAEERNKEGIPPAKEKQLTTLLDLPWKPKEAGLTLDDFGFYLGILSPNVGRIALREWISVSLGTLKHNLSTFRQGIKIVSAWGDRSHISSVAALLEALATENPNAARQFLRTAYLGQLPPIGFLPIAVQRISRLTLNENSLREQNRRSKRKIWDENWLASLTGYIKLVLFYETSEVITMEELDLSRKTQAYLSGRLLAVLERAQLMDADFKINATLVDRYYGAASTAPASVFGNLLRLATTAHLKEAGKTVNELMEEVMSLLDEAGGFKKTLTLAEQAEFALGFYHQRAKFRAGRKPNKTEEAA